jgi:hypothetical protein
MIQALLAMVFVFFLPGYLLINALYPRKDELDTEYDFLYRITLGIMMSVAITIFLGFGLNSLGVNPETDLGYFQAPYIWAALIILSVFFFLIGWLRGAYPILGRISPRLYRDTPRDEKSTLIYKKEDAYRVRDLKQMGKKRERLRKELGECEKKLKLYTGEDRNILESKRKRLQNQLKALDRDMKKLEEDIIGELV